MSDFIKLGNINVSIKDGFFYGHRVKSAHVQGTNKYRVIVDDNPAIEVDENGFYNLLVSLTPLGALE